MAYQPNDNRYDTMTYRRSGHSGVMLPALSLGLWNSFGGVADRENARALLQRAFDLGINHFDLANNYGPPPGSAEEMLNAILRKDFANHRDELIISTKAGYPMWSGPYGMFGSRKHLVSSLDQILTRLGLDYVDIFYSHRFDPETPLEETMGALDHIVRQGKALYVGISSYSPEKTAEAVKILRELGTPCLIHQPSYSLINRWIEKDLLRTLDEQGMGCMAFSPLAQGLLSSKYLDGVPGDSRMARGVPFFTEDYIREENMAIIRGLNAIASERGQTLAQMAIAWVLRDARVTSALIGASRPEQLDENVKALENTTFSDDELKKIDALAVDIDGINRWALSSSYS